MIHQLSSTSRPYTLSHKSAHTYRRVTCREPCGGVSGAVRSGRSQQACRLGKVICHGPDCSLQLLTADQTLPITATNTSTPGETQTEFTPIILLGLFNCLLPNLTSCQVLSTHELILQPNAIKEIFAHFSEFTFCTGGPLRKKTHTDTLYTKNIYTGCPKIRD